MRKSEEVRMLEPRARAPPVFRAASVQAERKTFGACSNTGQMLRIKDLKKQNNEIRETAESRKQR